MERIISRWRLTSPPVFIGLVVFILLTLLYMHQLSTLTYSQFAPSEAQALQHAQTWHSIWHNLLFAPYFVILRLVQYGSPDGLFYARLVGVGFGLLTIWLFYFTTHKWVGWRLATLGTILFATSSLALHTFRLVNPYMLQMVALTGLVALYAWSHKQPQRGQLMIWAAAVGLMLYVPGMLLPIVLGLWFNQQTLRSAWSTASKKMRVLTGAIATLLTTPILYFLIHFTLLVRNTHTLISWIGYGSPYTLAALKHSAKAILLVPVHLFLRGSNDALFGINRQPLLPVIVTALMVLGICIAISRLHEGRWRFTLTLLGMFWLLRALNGLNDATVSPLVYLFAVIGSAYMLSQWYMVFPRNPIARSFGLTLIILVIGLTSVYGIRSYFIAWPSTSATKQAFQCAPSMLAPCQNSPDLIQ